MSSAPADRFLEVISDPVARNIVRSLSERELTQAELVRILDAAQSVVSRAVKSLRSAGVIDSDTPRGSLRLRAAVETRTFLQAANNVAGALVRVDLEQQDELTTRTQRSVIRPVQRSGSATSSTGRDGA